MSVFKSGPRWLPDYVYRLRDAVARNLDRPYRFVCLSDMQLEVETLPLLPISNVKALPYWYKVQMFRPDLELHGPNLYIDLDTIVKGPLDPILDDCWQHDFLMSTCPWKGNISCSALMFWRGDRGHIWRTWCSESVQHWLNLYQVPKQIKRYGDQGFIGDHVDHKLMQQVIREPERIDRVRATAAPEKACILFCSGRRKPWDTPWNPDVQRYWSNDPDDSSL